MTRRSSVVLATAAGILLPVLAPATGLVGGDLRLEPAPPVSGVQAAAGQLRLRGLLGQPAAQRAEDDAVVLQSGFYTPEGVAPGGAIFSDGFEEGP